MSDIAEAPASRSELAAPGINVTAAPGVAFSYRYAFVVPDKKISALQEQHAAACEKLGPARCRITGMRYSLGAADHVSGELEFKLAPDIARQFGKDGIAAVEQAAGKLVDARIDGRDVGTQITASQGRSAALRAELARIEAQLASGRAKDEERAELQSRAASIREQLSAEGATRQEGQEALANTPMEFAYAGDAGFSFGSNPFADAGDTAWGSFTTMVSVVLLVVGAGLPWVLLLAVLLFAWRSRPGRWVKSRIQRTRPAPAEPA
ncbi:MAG: DUF4349 domain-containing protein [Novosphingobium sp.]